MTLRISDLDLLNANKKFCLGSAFILSAKRESSCMKEVNYIREYEQIVNMPKNSLKTLVVRKFRQMPEKLGLET